MCLRGLKDSNYLAGGDEGPLLTCDPSITRPPPHCHAFSLQMLECHEQNALISDCRECVGFELRSKNT